MPSKANVSLIADLAANLTLNLKSFEPNNLGSLRASYLTASEAYNSNGKKIL